MGKGREEGWEGMGRGEEEGREKSGMEGKGTEGMGGTGEDMGWDGGGSERERRKGREKKERVYNPQTLIPGAATAGMHMTIGALALALITRVCSQIRPRALLLPVTTPVIN